MKKLILLFLLCSGGLMIQTTSAQISIRANISTQPIWGPVGYDHVDNYYIPEIEAYYNVPTRQYSYKENGRWVSRTTLPARNRNFDMFKARKVVINGSRPYMRDREYSAKYRTSTEGSNLQSIRDSKDSKYFVNKNHPEYAKWKKNNRINGR